MNKKLFIRFWTSDVCSVPWSDFAICDDKLESSLRVKAIADQSDNIHRWFQEHPEGKVEFVWQ